MKMCLDDGNIVCEDAFYKFSIGTTNVQVFSATVQPFLLHLQSIKEKEKKRKESLMKLEPFKASSCKP